MQRREAMKLIAGSALAASIRTVPAAAATLANEEEAFLDDLQRRGCLYFAEQVSPNTGQVLDRAAANSTGKLDSRRMASIAATGFGLTVLCIAEHRGYQSRAQVLAQVRRTLKYHAETLPNEHGFFSHFNDLETGAPFPGSEISSIDTSLLLCGVLTARAHFSADAETVDLATRIYERVDWPWMLNGGKTFSMGWNRGKGFLDARWNHYCELMMIYLLALGSPTHPVPAECWDAWTRPHMQFGGIDYIGAPDPLFVHQYSHAWFDFRNQRDRYADYFQNSIQATRAHQAWCQSLGKPYTADYWGISASDSAHGYTAWGGPPGYGGVDGSVVPYTTAGALPFLPAAALKVQLALRGEFGERAWGRYGFCDAMHPAAGWYDPDVLGIDLGIGVLMAENLRTGFVWETFRKNPEVAVAFRRAGFHPA
jgi:hypothetical protein